MRRHIVMLLAQRTLPIAALLLPVAIAAAAEGNATQKTFQSPADAMKALGAACRTYDTAALAVILGPGSEDVISSGDPIADKAAARRIADAAAERLRPETLDSGAVVFHVGKDDWPLAIPVVKDGDTWRFDTAAGRDELVNRRVGRNELKAIEVSRAYVDAQREYARRDRIGAGFPTFAQKLRSDPGKQNGLYWDDPTGKHPSPLGPLLAEAAAEGYTTPEAGAAPRPYHGYFYRILTTQGPHAPGGARSYVGKGFMLGGFALLAYPAEHGGSGVMTFIVGPEGIVYQKDLGEKTAEVAKTMTVFDPDDSWTPVRD